MAVLASAIQEPVGGTATTGEAEGAHFMCQYMFVHDNFDLARDSALTTHVETVEHNNNNNVNKLTHLLTYSLETTMNSSFS